MLSFLNPSGFLLSLSALLPIALHFFERITAPEEVLPTLPLIRHGHDASRRSPHRILLLLIRVLILFLLGAFLASPIWVVNRGSRRQRLLILLDNGPGMARSLRGKSLLEHARSHALRLFEHAAASGQVYARVLRPYPGQLDGLSGRDAIIRSRLSAFPIDIPEIEAWVSSVVGDARQVFRIVVIGGGGPLFGGGAARLGMPLDYHYYSVQEKRNIAVVGVSGLPGLIIRGKQYRIVVTLDNTGSRFSSGNRLTVRYNGEVVAVRSLDIPAGKSSVRIPIRLFGGRGGKLSVELAEDEASFDNRYALLVDILDTIRVTLHPPYDSNPYLRSAFKAVALDAVTWIAPSAREALHILPDSLLRRLPGGGFPYSRAIVFPAGRGHTVFDVGQRVSDATVFRITPVRITNAREIRVAFPGTGFKMSMPFTQFILSDTQLSAPARPLFHTRTGEALGVLYSSPRERIAAFPFPVSRAGDFFLHPSFPDFFQRLLGALLGKDPADTLSPLPEEIRRATPVDEDRLWSGTFFAAPNRIFPVNIQRNWYRFGAKPEASALKRDSGATRLRVVSGDRDLGDTKAPIALGWLVILLIGLLKTGELYLLRGRR